MIEIVSSSSKRMDYLIKLLKYQKAGVKEYWVVDPERKSVMVYDFAGGDVDTYSFKDEIPVGIYDGDLKLKIE